MKMYMKYCVFWFLLVLIGTFPQITTAAEGNPSFSQQELDQMLAPIALYPDPLLSQILMAATYPLEIVEAARWSGVNPALRGDEAVKYVDTRNWDPSVKSLVAYPQVLQTLNQNIEWTERLGDAFLGQQSQVMDTVQRLRQKAQDAGYLSSNAKIEVTQSDDSIAVASADPEVVYVPYYDPAVVYGSWWWPDYPPVFWAPWAGYGWDGGFAWGIGIGVGAEFFFGSWDWRNHGVYAHDHRRLEESHSWQHDPDHRHGVPYRDVSLNRRFGRGVTAPPESRAEFRGHEPSLSARHVEPDNRVRSEPAQRLPLPETRSTRVQRSVNQPIIEPRAHAFENVGRGADVRNFSARGGASLSGRPPAPVAPVPKRESTRSEHH